MHDRSAVAYRCDGSLAGILCCIYESYTHRELPIDVLGPDVISLFPTRDIATDESHSLRVWKSVKRYGEAADWVRDCWLACIPDCERLLFQFIRRLYEIGGSICQRLDDPLSAAVFKAKRAVQNEAHLLKEFLRFTERSGVLVAEISPKGLVLPLMCSHFVDRLSGEKFIICDCTHNQAFFYQQGKSVIREFDELALEPIDDDERRWQSLWQGYYNTISIKERFNPKCRMNHMPKRFWAHLIEQPGQEKLPTIARPPLPQFTDTLKKL